MADALTGKTARRQLDLARQAQATQAAQLADQERKVAAVEAAQAKLLTGGGGGLFAYIDDKVTDPAKQGLKKYLGGQAAA